MSTVDARGQSCPTPVLRTKRAIDGGAAALTVLVDERVAVENVSRLARNSGFAVQVHAEADGFRLELSRP
jgi:TusA-related sulfurtransferase